MYFILYVPFIYTVYINKINRNKTYPHTLPFTKVKPNKYRLQHRPLLFKVSITIQEEEHDQLKAKLLESLVNTARKKNKKQNKTTKTYNRLDNRK